MNFETITLKKEEHIATITFNRPEKLNAMTVKFFPEMSAALENVHQDTETRVLILTGAGRAFCAGADISSGSLEGEGIPPGSSAEYMRQTAIRKLMAPIRLLVNLEIPTIAMVNGVAVGGGFDWALGCDIRIGSENARFMVAYTQVGLFPDMGGTWLMPRAMGLAKACELIFTGDFLEAKEAERIGVLNRVVPAADLERETMELARKIASKPPLALRLAKLQLRKGLLWDFETALEVEAGFVPIVMTSKDLQEAISALVEKRKAKFIGE